MRGPGPEGALAEDRAENVRGRDFRLVPVAVAAWAGSLLGLSGVSATFVLLLGLGIAGVGCRYRRAGVASSISAAAFALLTACGVSSIALTNHQSDPLAVAATEDRSVRVLAVIISDPTVSESPWGTSSVTAVARALQVRDGPSWTSSKAQLRLRAATTTRLSRGDTVVAFGRIDDSFGARPPSVGTLRARTVTVERPVTGWHGEAVQVKERLARATEGLPDHARGLIAGMAVGDDRLVSPALHESMLTSSLVHLTAVSGSHIAIVLGLLMIVLPGRGGARQISATLFLLLLVMVVGPEPSVLRAVGSAAIIGAGLLLKRSSQPQIALAAVVITAVMVEPWMATNFGFALSVLATWGIVHTGRRWIERARERGTLEPGATITRRLALRTFQAMLISLAAQLWVLPVTLLMNPWVPPWGVLANVVVMPAVPAITVLGLAAAAVSWFSPGIAHWLCWAAVPFTHWVEAASTFFSGLPFARLPWPRGPGGVALAAGLVGLVTVTTVTNGSLLRRMRGRERARDGSKELGVSDQSGRSVFGSRDIGQGVRGGTGRSSRSTDPSSRASPGPRYRAD